MSHGAGVAEAWGEGEPSPRTPFLDFFTPRPEEENFNEFGDGSEGVRDSLAGLLKGVSAAVSPRHGGPGGSHQARDEYLELPAGRDEEYDPYAREGGDQKVLLTQPSFLLSSLPERQEDFITVDWAHYAERDRDRRRKLERRIQKLPWYKQLFFHAWDGAQAWIALLLIGFLTGAIAAIIGIGCEWFTDLRFGVCRGRGFWITRDICCKDVHASEVPPVTPRARARPPRRCPRPPHGRGTVRFGLRHRQPTPRSRCCARMACPIIHVYRTQRNLCSIQYELRMSSASILAVK